MIAKREKLQYGYLFLTDLISLGISAALVFGYLASLVFEPKMKE